MRLYIILFQVSEGPSFALHRKTGEGGDLVDTKLILQQLSQLLSSTSERLRWGGVGEVLWGLLFEKKGPPEIYSNIS